MTLLFVVAVVMLSVRIAAVLVWLTHHHDNRVHFGEEERKTKFDRQVRTLRVPAQDYVTKDNLSVRVEAVVHYRIVGSGEAPTNTQNNHGTMSQLVQTSLRSAISKVERDDMLSNREFAAQSHPSTKPTQRGPQDAPPFGPHDAAGNPQDAVVGPQGAAVAELTTNHVDSSVGGLETPSEGQLPTTNVKADTASAIPVAVRRGTTNAARGVAAGRRMTLVKLGTGSRMRAGDPKRERAAAAEKTIVGSVPRPAGGPACLGGRGDAGYLRGWDDAVDWIGQGNEANPPTWGDVAYMTGWNDASRAIAKAGLAARTSPDPQIARSA